MTFLIVILSLCSYRHSGVESSSVGGIDRVAGLVYNEIIDN